MTDMTGYGTAGPLARMPATSAAPQPANLADLLERVLDKGIVIAGDIRVNLLDIELLTIRIRLLIASVDRAREMGIDWWEHDPTLTSGARDLAVENRRLRERIGELESGRTAGAVRRGTRRAGTATPVTATGAGRPAEPDRLDEPGEIDEPGESREPGKTAARPSRPATRGRKRKED